MGSSNALLGRSRPRAPLALLVVLAAVAACLAPTPAAAQESESASAQVEIVQSLSLQNTVDLDFGQVAYSAAGTVVLTPSQAPTCTVTGGVLQYGTCTAAVFVGYGVPGSSVRLKVPRAGGLTLAGPAGATMSVTNVTTQGAPSLGPPTNGNASSNGFRRHQIVSSDGSFEFRIGGTLNVAAGQPHGLYSTTFEIDIAYE